jgi:hypothetical protein
MKQRWAERIAIISLLVFEVACGAGTSSKDRPWSHSSTALGLHSVGFWRGSSGLERSRDELTSKQLEILGGLATTSGNDQCVEDLVNYELRVEDADGSRSTWPIVSGDGNSGRGGTRVMYESFSRSSALRARECASRSSRARKGRDEARAGARPEDVVEVRRSAGEGAGRQLQERGMGVAGGGRARVGRVHDFRTDAGGSNGYRSHVWKHELQRVGDKLDLAIHVSHFPPGTSKWNKVEHRLFSFISINWRGRPLRTYETVINLIGNTTNRGRLVVRARLDRRRYPVGKKIPARNPAR